MGEWIKDFFLALFVFFGGAAAILGGTVAVTWFAMSSADALGIPHGLAVVASISFVASAALACGFASRDRSKDA